MHNLARLSARFVFLVLAMGAFLSVVPLTFAKYTFQTETVIEGGYDYSVDKSEWIYDSTTHQEEIQWTHPEIEGVAPWENDLVVDSEGFVHGVIRVTGNGAPIGLQYVTNEHGRWEVDTIWSGSLSSSGYLGIEMDSKGVLHVLFANDGEIIYLTNYFGSWQPWLVDYASTDTIHDADFTLDEQDNLHLAYVDAQRQVSYAFVENFSNRGRIQNLQLNPTITVIKSPSYTLQSNYQLTPDDIFGDVEVATKDGAIAVAFGEDVYSSGVFSGTDIFYSTSLHRSQVWSTPLSMGLTPTDYEKIAEMAYAENNDLYLWSHYKQYVYKSGTWTEIAQLYGSSIVSYTNFGLNPINDHTVIGAGCQQGTCSLIQYTNPTQGQLLDDYSTIDFIDPSGAGFLSMDIDADGRPHMLYVDSSEPGYLKYATVTSSYDTVDDINLNAQNSLVATSKGDPYIAYYGESQSSLGGNLMLASKVGNASWTIRTLDLIGDTGLHPDIAVDGNDQLYISYYSSTDDAGNGTNDLMFASDCNGPWLTSTVDGDWGESVGLYSAIAVGRNGQIHILYYDSFNGDLRYATSNSCGASWRDELVDATPGANVGEQVSMVLAQDGTLYFSYYDLTNEDLKYGYGTSGSWYTQTLDSTDSTGTFSSIALDGDGKVHISYYSLTDSALEYISNDYTGPAPFYGLHGSIANGWDRTTVDNAGTVGAYSSIDLNNSGVPYISYYDTTNRDLLVATKNGTSWQSARMDDEEAGLWTSLYVDANTWIHIAYVTSRGDLRYIQL